jgi:regulator of sigma E protease
MFTAIIFIVVLGLLVFVHELGHFLVAKKSGMQVDEFGFGFPPRIFGMYVSPTGWKKVFGSRRPADAQGTVYSINAIPLGGFVKIVGENNDAPDNPNSFGKKTFFARLATLLAGVCMNALLAWVLISIGLMAGVPTVVDTQTPVESGATLRTPVVTILDVLPGSPAEQGGLKVGDAVERIDGQAMSGVDDVQSYITTRKGSEFTFTVLRGRTEVNLRVASQANPAPGEGPTGIALGLVGKLSYSPLRAVLVGFKETGHQLWNIVAGLGKLFTGGVALDQLGGPVKIAQLTGQASRLGLVYLLDFAAFLSLNLAVLNVLPIPALDGGRVLFLVIEKFRRKPNNATVEQTVNALGFLLLLLLMAVVTVNDFHGFALLGSLYHKFF